MKKSAAKQTKQSKKVWRTPVDSYQLILAGYIVVFLLAQLFSFDKFPAQLEAIGLGGWSVAVAIILVMVELLAVPFLIGLSMPKTLSLASRVAVYLSVILLTVLEVFAYMAGATIIFGASLDLPGGLWSVFLLIAMWMLLLWVAVSGSEQHK